MTLTDDQAKLLFSDARTFSHWRDAPVSDELLRQIYERMKWGPTSANCSPARIVFVRTTEAKERLAACMDAGNVAKVRAAPVTAIIGMDMAFPEMLPRLYPHADARAWFAGNLALTEKTAFRNSSLQGGYFIIAARSLGLDCGPMSGFDAGALNSAFFDGTAIQVNFVCSLGYGEPARLHPRGPRLEFNEACEVL
jgi:nitroreductase